MQVERFNQRISRVNFPLAIKCASVSISASTLCYSFGFLESLANVKFSKIFGSLSSNSVRVGLFDCGQVSTFIPAMLVPDPYPSQKPMKYASGKCAYFFLSIEVY